MTTGKTLWISNCSSVSLTRLKLVKTDGQVFILSTAHTPRSCIPSQFSGIWSLNIPKNSFRVNKVGVGNPLLLVKLEKVDPMVWENIYCHSILLAALDWKIRRRQRGVLGDVSSLYNYRGWHICGHAAEIEAVQLLGKMSRHGGGMQRNGMIHSWCQNWTWRLHEVWLVVLSRQVRYLWRRCLSYSLIWRHRRWKIRGQCRLSKPSVGGDVRPNMRGCGGVKAIPATFPFLGQAHPFWNFPWFCHFLDPYQQICTSKDQMGLVLQKVS